MSDSLHDYDDLVGIHFEFFCVITLNYSQQSEMNCCFSGAMATFYCPEMGYKHQPVQSVDEFGKVGLFFHVL